jgi:hypothetical protein
MARVIEEKIIERIHSWKEGNYSLSVRDRVEIKGDKADYYLWQSPIVTVYKEADGKKSVCFSFCGYASQTTKQRISELLWEFTHCYIFRKNWIHYLKMNDEYYTINENKTYTIKNGILFDSIGNKVEALKDFKY